MFLRIYPAPVTEQEKIFGILRDSPAVTLRNWLTYVLRFCIYQQETLACHNKKGLLNETDIKLVLPYSVSCIISISDAEIYSISFTQLMRFL